MFKHLRRPSYQKAYELAEFGEKSKFVPMKKILLFLQERQGELYRYLVFVLTAGLVIYLFPHTSRFKYEFRKGQVWLHDDLQAPFDFALYKSDEELERDRQELEMQKELFFRKEELSTRTRRADWAALLINTITEAERRGEVRVPPVLRDSLVQLGWQALTGVWNRGVVESLPNLEVRPHRLVEVVEDGIGRGRAYGTLADAEQARDYLRQQVEILPDSLKNLVLPRLMESLVPNVHFDPVTTQRLLEQRLQELSPTRGVVFEGELVVAKGQVVDEERYLILNSLKKNMELRSGADAFWWVLSGQVVLVLTLLGLLYLFLKHFRPQVLEDNNRITFLLLGLLLMAGMARLILVVDEALLYVAPFAILPVLLRAFFDTRLALFVHIVTLFLIGLIVPNPFEFAFLQFSAGVFAIVSVSTLYRRSQLFTASAKIVGVYALSYAGWVLLQEGDWRVLEWQRFGQFAVNGFLILLAYPLIYFFEKIFGFVSDLTLLELADTNQPLLRELAERAPGTFQHSLQVANLAESAVLEIGGNALLIRAGALYHDIGKMINPQYFIENQITGLNPHNELAFEESAEQIIGHVPKGIALAKKHKLPDALIDFIRTHHGTSKVQYFYRLYLKNVPEQEGDWKKFSYPGPKPFSKETAVLMIADSVEAASRSLKERSKEALEDLVDKIVKDQLEDGQFDQASITLREIGRVKNIFKKKLLTIYHLRVEYPHQ